MLDPIVSAREAGLFYVSDDEPGIRRIKKGRGFAFVDPDGDFITDRKLKKELQALGIPPAYNDVWICPHPHGHIQATARDVKGRKQYVYHPDWLAFRKQKKFEKVITFGEALPQLRARVKDDLRRKTLSRDKVIATAVRLMDQTLIRVGNEQYTRSNGSFGLTTLQDDHVQFDGSKVRIEFMGKSSKERCIELDDPRLARLIRMCRDVPGEQLFQYYDEDGEHYGIHSDDINTYLKTTTGGDFSAKDFRTWGGTVAAAGCALGISAEDHPGSKRLGAVIACVADKLGNTKAVCRAHYIHPRILDAYETGELDAGWPDLIAEDPTPGLTAEEHATLRFLQS
ncbi:MAG: DNA topoisomerase IB [Rhodothermales bacterium]